MTDRVLTSQILRFRAKGYYANHGGAHKQQVDLASMSRALLALYPEGHKPTEGFTVEGDWKHGFVLDGKEIRTARKSANVYQIRRFGCWENVSFFGVMVKTTEDAKVLLQWRVWEDFVRKMKEAKGP